MCNIAMKREYGTESQVNDSADFIYGHRSPANTFPVLERGQFGQNEDVIVPPTQSKGPIIQSVCLFVCVFHVFLRILSVDFSGVGHDVSNLAKN